MAELARSLLEDFGHAVRVARDAPEAMDMLNRGPRVNLLFPELDMPDGMNRVVLARETQRHRPRIKVPFTTCYAALDFERADADGAELDIIGTPPAAPRRRGGCGRCRTGRPA